MRILAVIFTALLVILAIPTEARAENPPPVSGRSEETEVFLYLRDTIGLNEAAACGILANIAAESGFDPEARGDVSNGAATSFGLCQWHLDRWDQLKDYCKAYGLREDSLYGQLSYIKTELEYYYTSLAQELKQVSNTADGAYDAGYLWCYYYENPYNREAKAVARGSNAATTYWTVYQPVDESAGKVSFTEEDAYGYYQVIQSAPARTYPSLADNAKGTVAEGTLLYMAARCVNDAGEVFYRASSGEWSGTYLSADVLTPVEEVEDRLTASEVSYPTRLVIGSAFTVSGSFRSTISGINYASVTILDEEGKETGVGKSVNLNRMEYSLLSLDSAVKFGSIPSPGTYVYRVEVRNASETYLLEQEFTVVPVVSLTISFDPQGGSCGTGEKLVESGGPCGTLPTPSREGYVFTGWYTAASGGSQVTERTKLTGEEDLTLYAHWSIPAPEELGAESMPDGSVHLTWKASANAESYVIYYRNAGYTAWNEYAVVTGLSADATGLPNAAEYEFSLRAARDSGSQRELSAGRSNIAQAVVLTTPAVPTILQAAHGPDGVTVTWSGGEGATGFLLEYAANDGAWESVSGLTGSAYSLSGLDDLLSYRFRLRAVSAYGGLSRESEFSPVLELGPKTIAPSPKNVEAGAGDGSRILLNWESSGAERYQVYYREQGENAWIRGPEVKETTAAVAGLKDRTVYEFTVSGVTGINGVPTEAGTTSQIASAAVFRAPNAPGGLTARRESGSIRVQWNGLEDAVSYELEYRVNDGDWKQVPELGEPGYLLSDAKEANTYRFRVRGLGSFSGYTKAGGFSDEVRVEAKPVASAPGGVSASSQPDGSVAITWRSIERADGYRVSYREVSDEGSGSGEWRALDPVTGTGDTVGGLTPLRNYEFRVASYTLVDGKKTYSSDFSGAVSAPSLLAPAAPERLTVERCADGTLHLLWTAAENATDYELSYRLENGEERLVTEIVCPEYTLQGLQPGASVTLRVSSVARAFGAEVRGGGSEPVTAEVSSLTGAELKDPAILPEATLSADGGIHLRWKEIPGCDGLRLSYARILSEEGEPLRWGTVFWEDVNGTAFSLPQPEDGAAYVITLRPYLVRGGEKLFSASAAGPVTAVSLREPDPPSGLAAHRTEPTGVELKWVDPGNRRYDLQLSYDGVNWETVSDIRGDTYTLEGIGPETRCYFRMRALRECRGVTVAGIYGSTVLLRAKGEPTAWMSAESRDDGALELKWETASGADGYRVYSRMIVDREGRSLEGDVWRMSEFITGDRYTLEGLEPGCVYELRISAYRDQGGVKTLLEDYSAGTAAPSLVPPELPRALRAELRQNGTLIVTWEPSEGANRYVVSYSQNGADWQKIITLEDGGCEIHGLDTGSGYTVRVAAVSSLMGRSQQSDEAETYSLIES